MLIQPANRKMMIWLLITSLFLLAFVIILVFVTGNTSPDEEAFTVIAPYISEDRTVFMQNISFLSNHRFLIPANLFFIAYLLSRKDKWGAFTAALVALSSLGLMSLLKNLIGRHRPANSLVQGITNFGFPSGHALMGVAFYGLLIWWIMDNIKDKWQKRIMISFLLFLLFLIGFSRVYLRVHYPTDVIAGYCIGTAWLISCLWLMDKVRRRKN